MSRADRLSRLISKWQDDRRELVSIRNYFSNAPAQQACVDIADFGLKMLDRCIDDFQRANYPLDSPQAANAGATTVEEGAPGSAQK